MKTKMFCLPYAGGGASVYNPWKESLSDMYDVIPVEYAGHAGRYCDEFYNSIEAAAEEIGKSISKQINGEYIIYGHSMGCLVALEVAYYLQQKGSKMPKILMLGGSKPPHLMYKNNNLNDLSRDELMTEVAKLGQMEKEVFDVPELYEIVSEILYSDFQLMKKYKRNSDEKLNIPICAMFGTDDYDAPKEDVLEWDLYTRAGFETKEFEGGHFFAFNDNMNFINFLKDFK